MTTFLATALASLVPKTAMVVLLAVRIAICPVAIDAAGHASIDTPANSKM